jgi:hypothetical protein
VTPAAGPNLARRPFANRRPLRRLALLLWALAAATTAWNVQAYLASGAGAAAHAEQLERVRAQSEGARARIETLEGDLARADLAALNLRTEYLNQRIAERAFSWNRLLDHLVEAMPRQVRVSRVAPEGFRDDGSVRTGRTPTSAERRTTLRLSGEASDDEALLEFVDRLFAHPAFDSPNLSSEARTRAGNLDFEMTVGYWPAGRPPDSSPGAAVQALAIGGPSATAPPATVAGEAAPAIAEVVAAVPAEPGVSASGSPARGTEVAPGLTAPPEAEPPTPAVAGASPTDRPRLGAPSADRAAAASRGAESPAPAERVGSGGDEEPAQPTPAPATSIFGVPLAAKPYASGGAR